MTASESPFWHAECHDESTCPLTILFGHPAFIRAYVDGTAEENWPPERLAELVLDLLSASPLSVTDGIRARVNSCSDPELLREWAARALGATSAEELFRDGVG